MFFNSIHFLFFCPLVVSLYYLFREERRWILLLLASYYFYMAWKPEYAILLITSTVVDYFAAIKMASIDIKKKRRPYLMLSMATNLGLLFFFKYYNFFLDNLATVTNVFGFNLTLPVSTLLLPVGISFYTFQTMAYSIDVYHDRIDPEYHFGKFALFVSFFPQLVAGPIERASNLMPQLRNLNFKFKEDKVISGICKMLWGLVKKIVIADRLGVYVDQVYAFPEIYNSTTLLIATTFFYIQIYCDFSGYSDIAIGVSRVMGINLMENFRFPFFSRNIREFWQRWHVSMTTWFRDYIYFSMGGTRDGFFKSLVYMFILFLIVGLWHGARWTYIAWGGLHAIYMISHRIYSKVSSKEISLDTPFSKAEIPSIVITFIALVYSNVLFRAENLRQAFFISKKLVSFSSYGPLHFFGGKFDMFSLQLSLLLIFMLLGYEFISYRRSFSSCAYNVTDNKYFLILDKFLPRVILSIFFVSLIITFGVFGSDKFIYFDF